MVEYTRDKILPEDLIQKTNLQQHNFMIDAINDIDGRQADIEDVTNVNIDDIAVLKTGVVALSNEKLDKADINEDLHFGDISVTRDGTAVIMSLDVLNPTTGIVTPISFTIPGATSVEAGTMDASSVAWIADAEERISALEGLSDVKAVADLTGAPTQAELTTGWVAVAGKQPETGDILQDINNSKLWVFVGTDWVLYGTIVTVPLATTSTIGGVRDTSLTAPGNRWYVHVEADGRLSLIGGDTLTTLMDTTIPALQSGVSNAVKKTGNEDIAGVKTFLSSPVVYHLNTNVLLKSKANNSLISFYNNDSEERISLVRSVDDGVTAAHTQILASNPRNGANGSLVVWAIDSDNNGYATVSMRSNPGIDDIIVRRYLDTRLTSKQDNLTFDSAPVAGSNNPVKSGGVYNALAAKQGVFSLYEHNIVGNGTISGATFGFSLTVLNQSEYSFTRGSLRSYLGSAANDYQPCSGVGWWDGDEVILIGIRGGAETEFVFQGVNRTDGGVLTTVGYDWTLDTMTFNDRMRQIV